MRYGLIPLLVICMSFTALSQEWVGTRPRVIDWTWTRSGVADRVRLGVRTEGLYAVTVNEVATAMNLSTNFVLTSFQETNLLVTCQGEPVACAVSNQVLYFYGVPAFSKRAPENIYWLQLNTGALPPLLPPASPVTNDWSMSRITVQGTNEVSYLTIGTLTNLPSFLAFKLISGGKDGSVTLALPQGITNSLPCEVTVTLLSAISGETASPDNHSARVFVNGTLVGNPFWSNECYTNFTYSVPSSLLTNGVAVIQVTNLLAVSTTTRFFWSKVSISFPLLADASSQVLLAPSIRGVCDADGFAADNTADYVVVIPPEGWVEGFRETIQPLIQFRARQGLHTAVMDVEALYNRFTYGLADPEAIRAFCRSAYEASNIKLKYLLLVGPGSLDFAHERYSVPNYQACLIPPLIASQRFSTGHAMIVAIDQAFGDVSGNSAPEIAVGRLPTAKTQELAVAVAKMLAYEEALPWKMKAAVAADSSFTNDMKIVKAPLEISGKQVTTCAPATFAVWNSTLKPLLQAGVGSFWFIGHSSDTFLGDGPLLDISKLKATSWSCNPIAVLMGCQLNRWQSMNVTNPDEATAFGPFSVFRAGTGFSAVFASTGYAWDGEVGPLGETQRLALYLSKRSGTNDIYRIGDAICAAEQQLAIYDPLPDSLLPYWDPGPITAERLQSYSLVGDPAMMWRHDYSATGTPVSWLLSYGLTAWDGDVSDFDGDGWKAWQEYQAGTRPDTNRFHIAMQALDPSAGALGLTFETKANKTYRILWKYALEDSAPWTPIAWALPGQIEALHSSDQFIIPAAALSTICVPVRHEDKQVFYRIQEVE
jgi:hypothetical protein